MNTHFVHLKDVTAVAMDIHISEITLHSTKLRKYRYFECFVWLRRRYERWIELSVYGDPLPMLW